MTEYGVIPTGFNRKPLAVILAELEAQMVTEFGPDVIQTSQSPLGQINGLFADALTQLWELQEDVYQSYDPNQAEGARLDMLARLRLISRGQLTDSELRQAMTNAGQGRIDIQDLARAISSIEGVTYSQVFVNDSGETQNPELERGFVALAVVGGDDEEIAEVLRRYIVPGVSTYGNALVTSNVDGFCRSMSIIRPIEIVVNVSLQVRVRRDLANCPPPSLEAIRQTLEQEWMVSRTNGLDVSAFTLRSIVEGIFSNVEVVSFTGARDGIVSPANQPIGIAFIEIAKLVVEVTQL